MAYIDVVDHEEADGRLKEIYDDLTRKRGKLAEVHKIQSLNPESIVNHMDLYMTVMFGKSPLKRYQRELIAIVVSAANNCIYCQKHHAAALKAFWKDEKKVEKVRQDYTGVDLDTCDKLLCDYGVELTQDANSAKIPDIVDRLKASGFSDRAVLDAALVTSYFNFVNRMVLGLGVQLEEDEGEGYKYE